MNHYQDYRESIKIMWINQLPLTKHSLFLLFIVYCLLFIVYNIILQYVHHLIMDNFLKIATNRNSLKALTKDFYLDELEKLVNNINIIIEQRKESEAKLKEKHKEKIQKIENIKTLLSEQGLSVDDLINDPVAAINTHSKPKKKLKPKYRIIDLDGETHEWTGRGRAPRVFKKYFELGHPKESCLITNNATL